MKNQQIHIYYDKEADYLEIRLGEATESYYKKIAPDTFIRIDEKTGEIRGYAIFNTKKTEKPLSSIKLDLPDSFLNLCPTDS
jgi:uncharacterized protein YuzE